VQTPPVSDQHDARIVWVCDFVGQGDVDDLREGVEDRVAAAVSIGTVTGSVRSSGPKPRQHSVIDAVR
jgi:hypothetical protein